MTAKWRLFYSEAIGNPVNPEGLKGEYEVFEGTKTECREFAEKWNSFKAVWKVQREEQGGVEMEVIFLNTLRPLQRKRTGE